MSEAIYHRLGKQTEILLTQRKTRDVFIYLRGVEQHNISQAVSLHECVFGEVILELNKKCSFNLLFSSAAQ